MTEMINISAEELKSLRDRLEKLAAEKSYLNLLIHMMSRLSAVSGIEDTVEAMLQVILNNIGGVNLKIYYFIDDNIYYSDVFGEKMKLDVIEDASVKKVLESHEPAVYEHDFSDTMMMTPEFTKAMTWVFPLLVGPDLIGVLKMEGMHMGTDALRQQLPTFFSYAALILKNEILGQTRLNKAYNQLTEVNIELKNGVAGRIQVEETLIQIRKAIESSGEAIGMSDPQGSHFYHNKAFLDLFEYSVEELNKPLAPIVTYADPEVGREVFETIIQGNPWMGETTMVAKSGRRFPVYLRADAIKDDNGNIIGLIGIHTDITERKQTEQRLSEEVALKNFLIDLYKKEPALADKDLYDYVLDYVVHLTDSTIGFFHLVSDDQKNVILTTWNTEALRNCTASYATHYPLDQAGNWVDCVRLRRPVIYNEFSSSPNRKGLPEGHTTVRRFMSIPVVEGDKVRIIFGVGNKSKEYRELDAVRIQIVANDLQRIMARRRAEIALSSSEAHFRSLIENASDIITILNTDGTVCYISPSLEHVVGFKPSELVHRNIFEYVHPEDVSAARDLFTRTIQNPDIALSTELRLLHNDGSWRILELVCQNMMENEAVKGVVVNSRDITSRKKVEEELHTLNEELEEKVQERTKQLLNAQQQLIRKEKLAILGQLAGIVGHEIRNPLGVINNAVYFLKTVMTDADDIVKEYLDIIKQEIDNSQHIIADLLDFARTKIPKITPITVGALVTQALDKCTKPENIDVQTDIPDTLPQVNVDPFQMGQVLQNLIINAVQAMPAGGALRITAQRVASFKTKVASSESESSLLQLETFNLKPDTDFIEISITDTGEGISPENMEKLFQPLFTTKSKGIGLGLVVCKNLVEANGGKIEVESKPEKGTTFRIILPVEAGK